MAKITYIVSKGYALVGNTGAPATPLNPGERTRFNPDLVSHKAIQQEIEEGGSTADLLEIVEVDTEVEKRQAEEQKKAQEEAEKIAAQARDDQLAAERQAAGEGIYNPEENNVADVVEYLRGASAEEVARVQELEANSSRASKRIADFEPSGGGDTTAGSEGTSPGQDSADGGGG